MLDKAFANGPVNLICTQNVARPSVGVNVDSYNSHVGKDRPSHLHALDMIHKAVQAKNDSASLLHFVISLLMLS